MEFNPIKKIITHYRNTIIRTDDESYNGMDSDTVDLIPNDTDIDAIVVATKRFQMIIDSDCTESIPIVNGMDTVETLSICDDVRDAANTRLIWSCTVCDKTYATSFGLLHIHVSKHLNVRWSCDVCNKTF